MSALSNLQQSSVIIVSMGIFFLFYFHVAWINTRTPVPLSGPCFIEGSELKVTVYHDWESRQQQNEAAAHMEFAIRKQRAVNVHFCLAPFLDLHGPGFQLGHSALTLGCLPNPIKLIRAIPTGMSEGSPPRWLSNLWSRQWALPLTGMRSCHIGNHVTRLSTLRYTYLLVRTPLTLVSGPWQCSLGQVLQG